MEAVEYIQLTDIVGSDTLNEVGRAGLQFTGDLTQRVLKGRRRAAEKDKYEVLFT